MNSTIILNVGLNVGTNNALRVNETMLDREMKTYAIGYFKKIPVRIPEGETFTYYNETKVFEDTNIYIFGDNTPYFGEIEIKELCERYGQVCIPFKRYDENLLPIYSALIYSPNATKEQREMYGTFQNEYFCNPFKF